MTLRRPLQIASGQTQQLQDGDGIDLGVNAPGPQLPAPVLRGAVSNDAFPVWAGGIYSASAVDVYLILSGEITGGTQADPTFTSSYGGGWLRRRSGSLALGVLAAGGAATECLTLGSVYNTSQLPLALPDGTADAPAITFASDTDTGLYRSGDDSLSVATGGAERIRVTNSLTSFYTPVSFESNPRPGDSGATDVVNKKWVESRLENLVTNGSGHMGSNCNFSLFTFDTADTRQGRCGSFRKRGSYTTGYADDVIPVDPSKVYRYSVWAKSGDLDGSNYHPASRQYIGLQELDCDRNIIYSYHVLKVAGSTDTTLAAPLNPGDTTVQLTDATGWYAGSAGHNRHFAWWPYTTSKGYSYPNHTYTRNTSHLYNGTSDGTWLAGAISGNTIVLRVPWAGPALPAGTPVRNALYTSSYKYPLVANAGIPTTWTQYSATIGTIDGTDGVNRFRYGTAYVRPLILVNTHSVDDTTVRLSDMTFAEDLNSNLRWPLEAADGTAAAPSCTFAADTNTGIYRSAADTLSVATGGVARLHIANAALSSAVPYQGPDGTAAAPAISFSGDPDTGFYRITGGVGLSVHGTSLFEAGGSALEMKVPVWAVDGTAAAPGMAFWNDSNTGLYRPGDDTLGLATAGAERIRIQNQGISLGGAGMSANALNTISFAPGPYPSDSPENALQLWHCQFSNKLKYRDVMGRYITLGDPVFDWINRHMGILRSNPANGQIIQWGLPQNPTVYGSVVDGFKDTYGVFSRFITAAGVDQDAGLETTFDLFRRDQDPELAFRIRLSTSQMSYARTWLGIFSNTNLKASSTPAGCHYMAFRYAVDVDGTSYWRCVTDNGSGSPTVTVTSQALYNGIILFRILCSEAGGWVKFFINDTLLATHTTTLPDPTTNLGFCYNVRNLSTYQRTHYFGNCAFSHV